jgi:hypothetical protein
MTFNENSFSKKIIALVKSINTMLYNTEYTLSDVHKLCKEFNENTGAIVELNGIHDNPEFNHTDSSPKATSYASITIIGNTMNRVTFKADRLNKNTFMVYSENTVEQILRSPIDQVNIPVDFIVGDEINFQAVINAATNTIMAIDAIRIFKKPNAKIADTLAYVQTAVTSMIDLCDRISEKAETDLNPDHEKVAAPEPAPAPVTENVPSPGHEKIAVNDVVKHESFAHNAVDFIDNIKKPQVYEAIYATATLTELLKKFVDEYKIAEAIMGLKSIAENADDDMRKYLSIFSKLDIDEKVLKYIIDLSIADFVENHVSAVINGGKENFNWALTIDYPDGKKF